MSKSKRIISLLLAVVVLATLFSAFSVTFAATYSGSCGTNVNWTLNTDTGVLSITGSGAMNGYSSSGAPWYSYRSSIKTVSIKNGVTSIGSHAFSGCTGLTSVTIPDSVTSIGAYAFRNCTGLTSITIPNSVTSIGESAFYGCTGLTNITIPNSVTSIGSYAFWDCTRLTSVTIPNSVTSIGGGAFTGCTGLTSITIPNSVTSIGADAFYGCTGLTNITIPNSVTSIGKRAFYGCTRLTSITIPDSVTSIGNDAFSGCTGLTGVYITDLAAWCKTSFQDYDANPLYYAKKLYLNGSLVTSLDIPSGVTNIGAYAFSGCTGLTSVTIPNSVTSIGYEAFYSCKSLTSVTIPNSVTSIGADAFRNCTGLTSITIPNSVTSIGESAFYGCTGLTNITIPNSVTSIGYEAFYRCTGLTGVYITDLAAWCKISFASGNANPLCYAKKLYLNGSLVTSLDIPGNVTSIGSFAFYQCTGLTSATIPDSVADVGSYAFYGCTGLSNVSIGNGVTSIGGSAFYGCAKLAVINVGSANPNYCSEDGVLYNKDKTTILNYPAKKPGTSFAIPDSVTSIESYAFDGCTGLTSVTIPNSVTSIGSYAFYGCTGLTSVTIPNSVTSIGSSAFSGCTGLTSVTIPNSVTIIGDDAFSGCTGLTSVTIPNSVTSIGDYAFFYCTGLTSITIPNSVTRIGNLAFVDCTKLAAFNVGSTNPNYCSENGVLYNKDKTVILCYPAGKTDASFVIPNSVTSIGSYAFYGCTRLINVTIGNGVASIGKDAFYYCISLQDVTYNGMPNEWKKINIATTGNDRLMSAEIYYAGFHGDCGTNVKWKFSESTGVLSITGSGTMDNYSSSSNVPWYEYRSFIQSVTIGNGVKGIGNYAFSGCTGLTSVTIPNSVTGIGSAAFNGCTGLTGVYITDLAAWCKLSFASSDVNPLYYAKKLYLNGSLVTSLDIPGSVTSIGSYAFYNCTDLISVTIPNSVTSVGNCVFRGCTGLAAINVGGANPNYCSENGVLYNKDKTAILCYPAGKTDTSFVIPNSVTSIESYAFEGCHGLESITIPIGVSRVGNYAFYGCSALKNVSYGGHSGEWGKISIGTNNTPLTGAARTYAYHYKGSCGENVNWTLNTDTGVLSITGSGAMSGYSSSGAPWYPYRSSIKTVSIENGLTSIGSYAFSGCTGLTSVTIPNSVTSIGGSAFNACSGLKNITIPGSVTSIGGGAFNGCTGLTGVYITDLAAWCKISFASGNANPLCYAKKLYLNGSLVTSVDIPGSITSVGSYAFYNCTGLSNVSIGNSVTSIGGSAFYGCAALNEVRLPYNVTSIGDEAFRGCAGLQVINIPDYVTSIGQGAFYGCIALTSVTIPNDVVTIKSDTFNGCDHLRKIVIPSSVTRIENRAFYGCTRLDDMYYGGSAERWGNLTTYSIGSDNEPLLVANRHFNYTAVILTGISVSKKPNKVNYDLGEDLNTTGLILTLTYSDDTTNTVTTGFTVSGFSSATTGTKTVTVTYEDKTTTFTVTVSKKDEPVKPIVDPAKEFKDISKKAWYYGAVSYAVNNKLFEGSNGKFDPDGDMTRGMFVSVLARLAGVNVNNKVTTKFTDVKKGQWYTGAVKWASDNGIVTGSNGKFMPNDPITREQICTIFVTYAKYKKITLTPKQAAVTFKDAAKISKWARSAVTTCQRAGLVAGSNGNFDPKGKATRAAVAQIIMNFDKNFG